MKKRRKNIVRNYVKYHKFNNMECYGSCFVAAVREGPANVDRRDSQDAFAGCFAVDMQYCTGV